MVQDDPTHRQCAETIEAVNMRTAMLAFGRAAICLAAIPVRSDVLTSASKELQEQEQAAYCNGEQHYERGWCLFSYGQPNCKYQEASRQHNARCQVQRRHTMVVLGCRLAAAAVPRGVEL